MTEEKIIGREDEIDLYELYLRIKKRKKFILSFFLITTLLSIIISLILPKQYKSEATIMPISSSSLGELSQLASLAGISTSKADPSMKILAVLNSALIREMVVIELNLVEKLEIKPGKNINPIYAGVRHLEKIVNIKQDKKLGTITIDCVVKDPLLAKEIVEKYLEKLKIILSEKALTLAKANRVFLEEELNKVKKEIDIQKSLLAKFQKRERILEPTEQIKGSLSLYAELVAKKMTTEVEIRQLESILSPDNPTIKSKRELLENIKRELKKLETVNDGAMMGFSEAPSAIKGYSDILMKLKTSEELYKNIYMLYEKARLEELKDDLFVEVIDYPKIPDIKFKPKRSFIVVTSALSSIFIAIFIVFFREYLENISSRTKTQ